MTDSPQITLITPPNAAPSFTDTLSACLDTVPVACVRMPGAQSPDTLARTADALREICHARDVAIVIETHLRLAAAHGLDGVHLTDGAKLVGLSRKELGDDAIVGAFCGTSRHDGMNAGEAGADYVAFGPITDTGLGTGALADLDLFAWWSQMIEVPVIAEGGLTTEALRQLAPVTDFVALGPELWQSEDPAAHLRALSHILEGKS